jgi:hypothetical protein
MPRLRGKEDRMNVLWFWLFFPVMSGIVFGIY